MIRWMTFASILVIGVEARASTVLDYKFDEGPVDQPALTVLDSGPNNITGVGGQVGKASLPTFRPDNTGLKLQFTGTGEALPTAVSYIGVSDPGASPLDLTGPLTVEAIIHPTLMDHMEIVCKKGGLAGSGYFMDIQNGHLLFRLQNDITAAVSAGTLQINQTYHVAGTWDGAMIRVYINGQLDGQFAYNGPLVDNNDTLGIGALIRTNGTIDEGFQGFMSEVRISDVALTPDQFLKVPEPTTFVLAAAGTIALLAFRQRRGRS